MRIISKITFFILTLAMGITPLYSMAMEPEEHEEQRKPSRAELFTKATGTGLLSTTLLLCGLSGLAGSGPTLFKAEDPRQYAPYKHAQPRFNRLFTLGLSAGLLWGAYTIGQKSVALFKQALH